MGEVYRARDATLGRDNAAGLAVCDGGIVIDLSLMRSVEVDPVQKRARAQGGATWRDFDRETAKHGPATTGGAISMTGIAGLLTTPDGARVAVAILGYNGPPEEGEKVIRPLREFGPPLADQTGPMPYTQLQSMLDEGFPAGLQVYWRSNFLRGIPNEAIEELTTQFSRVTSPLSALLLEQLGGAVSRVGRDETAFNHRDAAYNLAIIARWQDPKGADPHIAWTRAAHEAMERFATGGVYVNYLGEEGQDRVRAAYGDAKYARLVALKDRYDPDNLFRRNQNILPSRLQGAPA